MKILDKFASECDHALKTLTCKSTTNRPIPGASLNEPVLSQAQRKKIASLVRVNLAGEIAAQALYRSQALTAKDPKVQEQLAEAAIEEQDHLAWCRHRLTELGGKESLLNPLWYLGSLGIGTVAGIFGDKWNLGFVAETERQVEAHLENHLAQLPGIDEKTALLLRQMQEEEIAHRKKAETLGAQELPKPIKKLMNFTSKLLTKGSYRL